MKRRWPELAVVALGLTLRLLLPFTFDVHNGADFWSHAPYIRWYAQSWAPPPLNLSVEVFHPPGYYWLAGGFLRLGVTLQSVSWLSALPGCMRLIFFWLALQVVFPSRARVRLVALLVAVAIPSSLQIDGMLNAEALHAALAGAALLLIVAGLRTDDARRWVFAATAGLVIGLALLVKVSAVVLVGALALAALADAWAASGESRVRRAAPWLCGVAFAVAVAAPQYLRNQRIWGSLLPNSFETTQSFVANRTRDIPLLDRRPLEFYYAWQPSYFEYPFATERKSEPIRFWPTLVVSTFVDHYAFFFVWPPPTDEKPLAVNFRRMPEIALWPARLSFAGGTLLALVVVIAWWAALWAALKRRDAVWLTCLGLPCAAILAQLQFAVAYPFDNYGVIKGAYTQFAAAPLYALVGVAVDWLLNRRQRALAVLILAALALVAFYTLFARGVALLPLLR